MVEPVRHRQTKGAGTDMFDLQPPRHTSTLHYSVVLLFVRKVRSPIISGHVVSESLWPSRARSCHQFQLTPIASVRAGIAAA
jgi:hypothetical protein